MQMRRRQSQSAREPRRSGTATVEFAITAPLFLTLVLGLSEMSRALDVTTAMTGAVREGGRLATMDYGNKVPNGMTPNQKIIQDIRNMLSASGLPGASFTITITYAEGAKAGQTFDIANQSNYLQYFKISASVPYQSVGVIPKIMAGRNLQSSLVFRMGRTSLSD